jgi:hypothetical protein
MVSYNSIMDINKTIKVIQKRNRRVEADKAWETSFFRRALIMVFTYVVAYLWMDTVELEKAWLAALIPAGAYLISTVTFPPLREWWIKHFYR